MSARPAELENSTNSNAALFCDLSLGFTIALVVTNMVIAICGLVLNLLVIFVIALNRALRKDTTNRLLVSLAVADLIVNTFGQPSLAAQIVYTYRKRCTGTWAFYAFSISCSSSVFLSMLCLTMVTIERFLAVKAPVCHRKYLTPKLVSWVMAFIVLATFAFQAFSYHDRKDREFTRAWVFGVFCLIAIVMNTCTMIFTRRFLQKRSRSSSRNTAERKALKGKMQRVTLLLLLLVMALFSWIFIIVIVILFYAELLTLVVVYGILTLIFLNTCLNPVAYCFMAPDIRKATRLFVRKANPLRFLKRPAKEDDELPTPPATEPKSTSVTTVQIPRNSIGIETQLLVFRIIHMFLHRTHV